jgi:hypothetical protein
LSKINICSPKNDKFGYIGQSCSPKDASINTSSDMLDSKSAHVKRKQTIGIQNFQTYFDNKNHNRDKFSNPTNSIG